MTISQLARRYSLSRSTLLYYHRIGLLVPGARSPSGYRLYSSDDQQRLAQICEYRQAGLPLTDIAKILDAPGGSDADTLHRRLAAIGRQIRKLQAQQRLLAGMLERLSSGKVPALVDKTIWVDMLRAAGMDEKAMTDWHIAFETRAPQAHHDFLLSLGLDEKQALAIRNAVATAK